MSVVLIRYCAAITVMRKRLRWMQVMLSFTFNRRKATKYKMSGKFKVKNMLKSCDQQTEQWQNRESGKTSNVQHKIGASGNIRSTS